MTREILEMRNEFAERRKERRAAVVERVKTLKENGLTNRDISVLMGIPEASIRAYVKEVAL